MLLLSRKLSSFRPCFTAIKPTLHPPSTPPTLLRSLLPLSSSAPAIQTPATEPHFMEEYLVTARGLSSEKAAEASKVLNRIKSPQQPDSVLGFFRSYGFDDTQISKIISCKPRLLTFNVEKTLEPRFQALQDLGFSRSDLPHLVLSSPDVLNHNFFRAVLPKIELWKGLLGSTELMMKFLGKNRWFLGLLHYGLEKSILPNLKILRDCGISDQRISMVLKHHPRFIIRNPRSLKAQVELVEGLGIPRTDGRFLWALHIVRMVSESRFKSKLDLMRSLGWSELEFLSAFRTAPVFLSVSEGMMRKKVDFLMKEAGCKISDLAVQPKLLMYSLEKRLIPRFRVMKILKSRGLRGGNYNMCTIMNLQSNKFIENFVLCHKKEVPELYEVYTTGRDMGGDLMTCKSGI